MSIPEGYRKFEFIDPFEEHVGPLWYQDGDDALRFAFKATDKHANTAGQVHGGMLMTFADFARCLAAIPGLPGARCGPGALSGRGRPHRVDGRGGPAGTVVNLRARRDHGRRSGAPELQRNSQALASAGRCYPPG